MRINFSSQQKRLQITIANAGPRYTSGLNVKVTIASVFDGLGRTFEFYDELKSRISKFISAYQNYEKEKVRLLVGEKLFTNFSNNAEQLIRTINQIPDNGGKVVLPFGVLQQQAKKLRKDIEKCFDILREARKKEQEKKEGSEQELWGKEYYKEESQYLNKLISTVSELNYFGRNLAAIASNKKFVVLRGEAGSGKTHFLCDLTRERLERRLPTFIFLGQEFTESDPWKTILHKIKWLGTKKQFLDALERNATNKRTRAFIIVDAINEQKKRVIWSKLIEDIKPYKSICVILSVRTGFEFSVLNKKLRKQALDVIHEGFADREWDALTSFFNFYNLEPDLPLLFPDFTNPLFLKIFCESYQSHGNSINLRGHFGFTHIFEQYVKKQGKKALQEINSPNLDSINLVWWNTMKEIANYMVIHKVERIPSSELLTIVQKILPGQEEQYINSLEKNSLILKNPIYSTATPYSVLDYDYSFPYQKFSDHLIVRYLLSDSSKIKDVKTLFQVGGRLEYIMKEPWRFRGLVEALAIQIPERFEAKELILLAGKDFKNSTIAKDSFLQSLIWRDTKASKKGLTFFNSKRILRVINTIILKHNNGFDDVLETMLTVSAIPDHPLNARLLSAHLSKFSLAKRDSFWLPYLFYKHRNSSAVDRLVHWAIKISQKTSYDSESIELVGIALSWFLASSNRYLRDTTTKALVILLRNRIDILIKILKHFEKCNDPYITERLFAVAYGCSLTSGDSKISDLAVYIFKYYFKGKHLPIQILTRDYACGVIEKAIQLNAELKKSIDIDYLQPPFKSSWPSLFPSLKLLETKYKNKVYGPEKRPAYSTIWNSLMYNNGGGIADFGNYVLNSTVGHWSNKKLLRNGKAPKSEKTLAEEFVNSLTRTQKALWKKYRDSIRPSFKWPISLTLSDDKASKLVSSLPKAKKADKEKEKKLLEERRIRFENTLSPKDWSKYRRTVRFFDERKHEDELDTAKIQRWVFKKVIQLGWTPELFYNFDSNSSDSMRAAGKSERIGKKYQWIALNEILARIADNYAYKGSWGDTYSVYRGAWQAWLREIDPSHFLKLSHEEVKESAWWIKQKYKAWQKALTHDEWVEKDDISSLHESVLQIKDKSHIEWLCLNSYHKWREPTAPGRKASYSHKEREVWMMSRAYFVKSKDLNAIYNWAKEKKIPWGWFPETHSMSDVYLGEYPYSTAYTSLYGSRPMWEEAKDREKGLSFKVMRTFESYFDEANSYDCSLTDSVHVNLPAKYFIDGLKLSTNNPGEFIDKHGTVIAQDPTVKNEGGDCLLVRKEELLNFLKKKKLTLVWTTLGEKIIIGSSGEHGILEIGGFFYLNGLGKIKGKKFKNLRKNRKRTSVKKTALSN